MFQGTNAKNIFSYIYSSRELNVHEIKIFSNIVIS